MATSNTAWQSGRTLVFDRRTFRVLRSTCSWRVTTYVGKPSAVGQPTRPTAALGNGGQIKPIYADFEKAFDKVPYHLLLKKLQSYNLNVNVIQWIRSFLLSKTKS